MQVLRDHTLPDWVCRLIKAMFWLGFVFSASATAEICKYQDPAGNLHYQNTPPLKGWKTLSCTATDEPPPRKSSSRSTGVSSSGFPRVDSSTQRGRDDLRFRVLSEELATEEKLLAESRAAYANGAPRASADEQANPQRYAERLARLRQTVTLHEKNVEALRKELAGTK